MSQSENPQSQFKSAVTFTVIMVAGMTLAVIFAGLFLGLWLDKVFGTRPILTIVLMIASIPLSLVLLLRVVRVATRRLNNPEK